jgi:hypothetical protein
VGVEDDSPPAKPPGTPARTPPPVGDRDLAVLDFAAGQRFVLAVQVAALLEVTPDAAGRRLRRLRDAGYLRSDRPLRHDPAAFMATRAGLDAVGSPLGAVGGVELGLYAHDVGVAWLAIGARRGGFGDPLAIVTERQMRSADGRARRRGDPMEHGVRPLGVSGPRGGGGPHYPDLTVHTRSGHRIAIELELTTKDRRRRERILAGYAADRRWDAVVYLVREPAARAALERSARRVGASGLVQVRGFAWEGGRAPGRAGHGPVRGARRAITAGAAGRQHGP